MKLKNLFHISVIIFILFHSCTQRKVQQTSNSDLLIRLNSDSIAIELSGLTSLALEEIRNDSIPDSLWINFFAVYEEPADSEMRDFQPALEGSYTIDGQIIRFKPRDNFRENQVYFARCYTKLLLQDAEDLFKTHELFIQDGFTEFKFNVSK